MWNEVGGAVAADAEAAAAGHVMHVGRSWFRMTPMPAAATKTARIGVSREAVPAVRMAESLFERAPAEETGAVTEDEPVTDDGRGTVTMSWWSIGLAGAALLAIGAAAATVMVHPRVGAVVSVPATATVPVPTPATLEPLVPPPTPVVIEPMAAATSETPARPAIAETSVAHPVGRLAATASPSEAHPAARVVPSPVKRAVPAAPKRDRRAVTGRATAALEKTTAGRPSAAASKPWVDPFAE